MFTPLKNPPQLIAYSGLSCRIDFWYFERSGLLSSLRSESYPVEVVCSLVLLFPLHPVLTELRFRRIRISNCMVLVRSLTGTR
jgi:hypothetical protein